tara:strand:- start:19 stop:1074 length:1056 start_codon:yes stop_codon:yes gene_type:complete
MAYTDIDKPSDYFNTKLYTGNGSNNTSITGVGFQPDWVWVKARNIEYGHKLFDSVRGQGKRLSSNDADAESTVTNELTSFNSDGFTTNNNNGMNENNRPYVAWNWLAANGTASNTAGSINSTVSVNTTAGFSIVSYTGTGYPDSTNSATVGHGLGVAPKMVIVKNRIDAGNWTAGININSSIDFDKALMLNLSSAIEDYNGYFNDTNPTSSVFSVGFHSNTNGGSDALIAYCFAEKQGFSKFGNYTGNGSSNGTFIYTGFSPAFIMVKSTSSSGQWFMFDNKREGYNPENDRLIADVGDAEADPGQTDFLSNGFKMRFTSGNANGSGVSYIYMAFAENPFVTSTGIPAPAR